MAHAHVLSSSLVGGGSMNPDKLSLNLQFASNKSLTANSGPTPAFTRGSKATYNGFGASINNEWLIPTGTSNGRNSWAVPDGTVNHTLSYDGTRWVAGIDFGDFSQVTYYAANGSEWRPDKANWSGSGIPTGFVPIESIVDGNILITAEVNEPRFDHDLATGNCKGLLIEEARTNLVLQSNTFDTTWSKVNLNTTGTPAYINVERSPSGITNAEKLIGTSGSAAHQFRQDVTLAASTAYSISCFFKAGEQIYATIACIGLSNGNTDYSAFFNLSTGATTGSVTGFSSSSIIDTGNGWYRCVVTFTSSVLGGLLNVRFGGSSGGSVIYTGDGTSGIYIWGAQVEAGAFATTYLATTTTTLQRSADICSISSAAFTGFWNQSSGTLLEVFEASPNTNTTYVSASNGDITQNSVHFDNDTGNMRAVYYSGSAIQATLSLGAIGTVGIVNKIASAYTVNDFSASRNGGSVVTDASGLVPSGLTQINIGTDERSQTPTSYYSNKCIKSLKYFKKRLSNAKLQILST